MAESLKQKTLVSMLWNAMEKFGTSLFLFIANIVLARLLNPEDFGAIAMLMVFISLSETIVDAGFGTALIQKKYINNNDCSTIFVWNIIFSSLLYSLLFVLAPSIAAFYEISILKDILRIQGLVIPINSLALVHVALLKKKMDFKRIAKINLFAIIIGTLIGIASAFYGLGVWSLVIKLLLTSIIQVACYYSIKSWTPSITFKFSCFKSMFSFGGFIFLNRILNTLYHNIFVLIIGKYFSASTLGLYNQARKLEEIPRSALSSTINNVAFSSFSLINTNADRLKDAMSKYMRNLSFISVPLMILAIVVAEPLILTLFSEKWAKSTSYFQILCIGGLIITPIELNINALNALGKSKTSFVIRVLQYAICLILLFFFKRKGMTELLAAFVVGLYLSFIVTTYFANKHFEYSLEKQIGDMLPFILMSMLSLGVALIPLSFPFVLSNPVMLLSQSLLFVCTYIGLSFLFKRPEMKTYASALSTFVP